MYKYYNRQKFLRYCKIEEKSMQLKDKQGDMQWISKRN